MISAPKDPDTDLYPVYIYSFTEGILATFDTPGPFAYTWLVPDYANNRVIAFGRVHQPPDVYFVNPDSTYLLWTAPEEDEIIRK